MIYSRGGRREALYRSTMATGKYYAGVLMRLEHNAMSTLRLVIHDVFMDVDQQVEIPDLRRSM